MRLSVPVFIIAAVLLTVGCGKQQESEDMNVTPDQQLVHERLAMYADTDIAVDLSQLTDNQREMIRWLIEAGRLVDEVFWMQSSHDAIAMRDSLKAIEDPTSKEFLKYVMINYGPYDRIFEGERFVGTGPDRKPSGAAYYPADMTREEFERYVAAHPGEKAALESQYTVVVRDRDKIKAIPFHEYYPQTAQIAGALKEAAKYADNAGLKKYLELRAEAIISDDYYASDMAWMDLKDNDIDVVIGPIENYEDGMFNYKTAHECAVMVKDPEATKELQMFTQHIDAFERALPIREEYKRESAGSGNVLEVVNIVYFSGDFQAGVKTIAASLP
ncbi:MAG: hypothetical protein JXA28_12485, partial [Bacteroidetes bacterium]|nr:hypothetical protein [Bacteroidota bacterium]